MIKLKFIALSLKQNIYMERKNILREEIFEEISFDESFFNEPTVKIFVIIPFRTSLI